MSLCQKRRGRHCCLALFVAAKHSCYAKHCCRTVCSCFALPLEMFPLKSLHSICLQLTRSMLSAACSCNVHTPNRLIRHGCHTVVNIYCQCCFIACIVLCYRANLQLVRHYISGGTCRSLPLIIMCFCLSLGKSSWPNPVPGQKRRSQA